MCALRQEVDEQKKIKKIKKNFYFLFYIFIQFEFLTLYLHSCISYTI